MIKHSLKSFIKYGILTGIIIFIFFTFTKDGCTEIQQYLYCRWILSREGK